MHFLLLLWNLWLTSSLVMAQPHNPGEGAGPNPHPLSYPLPFALYSFLNMYLFAHRPRKYVLAGCSDTKAVDTLSGRIC